MRTGPTHLLVDQVAKDVLVSGIRTKCVCGAGGSLAGSHYIMPGQRAPGIRDYCYLEIDDTGSRSVEVGGLQRGTRTFSHTLLHADNWLNFHAAIVCESTSTDLAGGFQNHVDDVFGQTAMG